MPSITMDVEVESIDTIVRDELLWHLQECEDMNPDDEDLAEALRIVLRYYGETV